jgi:hypothetical protein
VVSGRKVSIPLECRHITDWYARSMNLRQTIMLSSYESPEMRALFNRGLQNVAGKLHVKGEIRPAIKAVKRGVQQTFVKLEVPNLSEEDNARFQHFKTRVSPRPAIATPADLLLDLSESSKVGSGVVRPHADIRSFLFRLFARRGIPEDDRRPRIHLHIRVRCVSMAAIAD